MLLNFLSYIRKCLFYLRKGGIKNLIKFIEFQKFENQVFGKKSLKWNTEGYWEMYPMPSESELFKFYSEIYWLNNHYYKDILLNYRDISHLKFVEKYMANSLGTNSTFLNFGAGHGGLSYLMAAKNIKVINIEPSKIYSSDLINFNSFKNLDEFNQSDLKNEKVDLLYSSHTLEHLTDPNYFFNSISKLLKPKGKVFIEVPNCRRLPIPKNYAEGGCDGKTTGSHLIYFTKDFFEKIGSEIFFISEQNNQTKYKEVTSEDEADCIRAIIKSEDISKYLKNYKKY